MIGEFCISHFDLLILLHVVFASAQGIPHFSEFQRGRESGFLFLSNQGPLRFFDPTTTRWITTQHKNHFPGEKTDDIHFHQSAQHGVPGSPFVSTRNETVLYHNLHTKNGMGRKGRRELGYGTGMGMGNGMQRDCSAMQCVCCTSVFLMPNFPPFFFILRYQHELHSHVYCYRFPPTNAKQVLRINHSLIIGVSVVVVVSLIDVYVFIL